MLSYAESHSTPCHVKFISYTGKYPCLCHGILTLEIDGKKVQFGSDSMSSFWYSGGCISSDYGSVYRNEWVIEVSEIPYEYQKYAKEIDEVFNENVEWGCCGGCI